MWKFAVDVAWDGQHPALKARAGKHEFILDEAVSGGGTDQGPNQLQYLLGALGGCFTAMGRLVASEMGLKLDAISVRVEAELNPDGLLDKDPSIRPGFNQIRLTYQVTTNEPADRMAVWLEKTERRCPVRDVIVQPTEVVVSSK